MSLTINGVDYAWAKPSPAGLKRAGHRFAMRYLSHDPSKDLSITELRALWGHGISVGVVWETTAQRALSGGSGGWTDARVADQRVKALGLSGIPIYFAVDWDVTPAQKPVVADYLRGAAKAIGKGRVGVYGGYHVVKYVADRNVCDWFWQTYAWSGGLLHPKAHIYQYRNGVRLAGGNVDLNKARSTGGFGVRGPKVTPAKKKPSARARARYKRRVAELDGILRAHPEWPASVRKALRWTRDRYKRALER